MKACFRAVATIVPVVVVAGCSAPEEASSEPDTVTLTTTVEAKPAPENTAVPQTKEASQVGGFCGTAGDDIEINASSATSCEFALAMYDAAISAEYQMRSVDPNDSTAPKAAMARGLQVASPVTGQTYTINCMKSSAGGSLICTQPGDDTVGATLNGPTPGYWHSDRAPA